MQKAISIKNLSKNYGKIQALANINLEVDNGELFGLIGPDGAGKTTLFRMLTTLLIADKGSVNIFDCDVVRDFRKIREFIGYMPGKFSLYQDLTVEENLKFFADVFGTTIEANYSNIRDIYEQIKPFKNRRAGQLSGGMKQKLALCCALIHSPKILFLDEPTTGVDPVSRKEFWAILENLKKQNMTIMVSTPYMDEAALCDRIAFIQSGKILSINTPQKIIEDYPFELFAAKSENNYHLLKKLKNNANVKMVYISGEYLRAVFKDSKAAQTEADFKRVQPTIEDCFMQMTAAEIDEL